MKTIFKTALLTGALALAGSAHAAVFNLNLTGTISNGNFSNQTIGATHYDQWFLGLDGLTPFQIAVGDTVNATVTLDHSFTVPASVQLTTFTFFLFGNSFPAIPTGTSGVAQTFVDAGTPTTSTCGATTTSSQLAAGCVYPSGVPITFDTFSTSFTIDTLATQADIDRSAILYTLFSPAAAVPEPASWALMLVGFGLVGAAMRRRVRQTVSFV